MNTFCIYVFISFKKISKILIITNGPDNEFEHKINYIFYTFSNNKLSEPLKEHVCKPNWQKKCLFDLH